MTKISTHSDFKHNQPASSPGPTTKQEALQRVLAETRVKYDETTALLEGTRAVLDHKDFQHAARSIFDACKKIIGAQAGYVALLSAQGIENELLFLDSGGLSCNVRPDLPMPIRGLRANAYKTNKAVYENDFSNSDWSRLLPEGHVRLDNVLFAPLVLKKKAAGLLGLANKPGGFTEHDVHIAAAFGELAAAALHNSQTLEALEKSEQRFRSVVQTANDAIISIDSLGKIVFWNPAAEKVFGYASGSIVGRSLATIIPKEFRQQHRKGIKRTMATGKSGLMGKTLEMDGLRKDGSRFPLELSLAMWEGKQKTFFTGIIRDVTKRKQRQEALERARDELEARVRERTHELVEINKTLKSEIADRKQAEKMAKKSHEKYQALWDNAPVAYHTLDKDGIITGVNATECAILGYTRKEMLGRPIFDFILPEQQKNARQRFQMKLQDKDVPKHEGRVYVKKNGMKIYVSIDDVLERNSHGDIAGVRTTMVDVTKRKEAEQALRKSQDALRRLSSRLLNVQEEERKKISRELHDSIGQSLAAIKFLAESALNQIDRHDTTEVRQSLKSLISLVQNTAEDVRKIHTDLRPSLLDDLGIASTISWFCREFEKVYKGIRTTNRVEIDEKRIPEPLKIIIFRIIQEALNNVSKHSQAGLVRISIYEEQGRLELAVEDNGRGFDVEKDCTPKGSEGGFGLTSMKERAELSGGTFVIESSRGIGSAIRVSWPIP